MATGRDIVHNLVLNSDRFVRGAAESRRAHREMTQGINRDIADVQAKLRASAEAEVRQGHHPSRSIELAREEVRLLKQRAEIEQLMEQRRAAAARPGASVPSAPAEIVRARRTEEQQLTRTRQLIQQVAAEEARTGQSREHQLQRLIRLQATLNARIDERQAIVSRATDRMFIGPMPAAAVPQAAAIVRERRTEEQQLARIKLLIQQVAAEEIRTGQSRAHQIQRLIRLEASLTATIQQQAAVVGRAREAMFVGPRPAPGMRPGRAGGFGPGGLGHGLAHGFQDLFISMHYMGATGASLALSNNLPMIGESVAQVSARFAQGAGRAAAFASVLSRFAGPAGLIASVALPMGAMLIPKLLESRDAFEEARAAAEAWGQIDILRHWREVPALPDFQTIDEARRRVTEGQESERRAGQARQIAELELEQAVRPTLGGFTRAYVRRLLATDPTDPTQGSAFLAFSRQFQLRHKARPSIVTEGTADALSGLDVAGRQAILAAEKEVQRTRLEARQSALATDSARGGLEEAERRDEFFRLVTPYFGRIGQAAEGWWRSIRETKERQDAVARMTGELQRIIDPDRAAAGSIVKDLLARHEEVARLFPKGGERATALLTMAGRAAAARAAELRDRLTPDTRERPTRWDLLPEGVTRGQSADFLNTMRATLQNGRTDPIEKLAAENKQDNAQIIKRLDRLIEELKNQPDSRPTSIGF